MEDGDYTEKQGEEAQEERHADKEVGEEKDDE